MTESSNPSRVESGGIEPLDPKRKWQTITLATLLLVPAFWALVAGSVSGTTDGTDGPNPAAAIAVGLMLVPFVFVVLAFMSEHPHAPMAIAKALGLAFLIGIPASALAGDAVTGIIAGVGAGAICALRADAPHNWRARAIAVAVATVYTFVLIRTTGAAALLFAPVFPLTGIGIADHLSERRFEREATRA